jgi:hypothetical protein
VKTAARLTHRLRQRSARVALLQGAGFAAIAFALGMWLVPVGIAAAGVSLLVMSALLE